MSNVGVGFLGIVDNLERQAMERRKAYEAIQEQLDRANARIATLQSLRDTLAETIASGRLREIDIPDDYEALVRGIAATRESGEGMTLRLLESPWRVSLGISRMRMRHSARRWPPLRRSSPR